MRDEAGIRIPPANDCCQPEAVIDQLVPNVGCLGTAAFAHAPFRQLSDGETLKKLDPN
jgi:hypothetical protein